MKALAWVIVAAALAPLALSVAVSFTPSQFLELPRGAWTLDWYRAFWSNPLWTQALANSLVIAVMTAALAVAVGLTAALALVRGRLGAKPLWEAALLAPLVLPGVALAAGMLAWIRKSPLWGTHLSLALAHATLATPVAYLVLRAALEKIDPELEAAARGLGARPAQAFRLVTLPLLGPALLAASLFALAISLNEVTLTLFLATRYTETLPRVIWPNLRFALTPLAAAASGVLLALTLPAVAAAGWRLRPRGRSR